MRIVRVVAMAALLAVPVFVAAQTVDSYTLKVYNAGAPTPKQSTSILKSAFACNQSAAPAQNQVNPGRIVLNDPVNTGKFCVWADATGGPLLGQPTGDYELTLTAVNSVGASAESARAPFQRVAAPATPTGVYVAQ